MTDRETAIAVPNPWRMQTHAEVAEPSAPQPQGASASQPQNPAAAARQTLNGLISSVTGLFRPSDPQHPTPQPSGAQLPSTQAPQTLSSSAPQTLPPRAQNYAVENPDQPQSGYQYWKVDLGYTEILVPVPSGQGSYWKARLILGCCPCCIDGPAKAWKTFKHEGAYKSFVFIVCMAELVLFILELIIFGFASPSQNPMLGPGVCAHLEMGAKWTRDIVYRGHVHRLILPIFLHAGIFHLAVNLMASFELGLKCEYSWGTKAVAGIYLSSGIVGNIFSAFGSPNAVGVGASGAILGILGATGAELWTKWESFSQEERLQQSQSFGITLILLIIVGFAGGSVDNWAHFGGFIAGENASPGPPQAYQSWERAKTSSLKSPNPDPKP
mmetsp:Transcript_25407/g.39852  ORF Transcript_25407/g.39852 Transcript_25407/m.39852 type:complete len:384 (-) Transcript_25407:434-1585(-)